MDRERMSGATFALEDIGWIDFETKSLHTQITAGDYRYACDATALMCAWAIGAGPVTVTVVKDFNGTLKWADLPVPLRKFHDRVQRGKARWAAWKATFDRAIWNYATEGFPEASPRHFIDVMVQAVASGLAPDLASAAKQSFSAHKAAEGKKLIRLFCVPGSTATPQSHPAEWAQFIAYAGQDIEAARSVFLGTRQLALAEWEEYWAMEAINDRGIGIDLPMVKRAADLATEDKKRTKQEILKLTGGEVPSVDHVKLLTGWTFRNLPPEGRAMLIKREEEVDEEGTVTKPAKMQLTRKRIERLLAYVDTLPDPGPVKRVLQIRQYGGSKTPAKFAKMLQQHVDGVIYGQYAFNGAAQTGRASSRGVQIHNLARDFLSYEYDAIDALIYEASYDKFAAMGDGAPVSRKLSLLIRPALVPEPGNVFVWSDWSQIEARVLPWLVGADPRAEARLQVFRDVDADPSLPDLYTRTAATLSHVEIKDVTKAMRQRGKVAELALGFCGGVGALQAMGAGYGLHLSDEEAKQTVTAWRAANGWCLDYSQLIWKAVRAAMLNPVDEKGNPIAYPAGRVAAVYLPGYLGGSLLLILPSGRCLTYRNIKWQDIDVLDDDDQPTGEKKLELMFSRGHGRLKLWPGMFMENITQATAADFLRGTLRRLVEQDSPVRLHTHDEILVEVKESDADYVKRALHTLMCKGFSWSGGLPIMSEETVGDYYTKFED